MPATKKPAKRAPSFTDDERAAMKDRASELKNTARRGSGTAKQDGEADLLAKIAEMTEPDRSKAERIHDIVKEVAPDLTSKTWYGMPAYAKGNDTICFFQPAQKFKSRYAMLGFSDKANLDDGAMWPVYYALAELTADDEAKIGKLIKKAVS